MIAPDTTTASVITGDTQSMPVTEVSAIPEIATPADDNQLIPIAEAPIGGVKQTFKKRSNDEAKVIMISGKQAGKLRASLPTQEALLSAKGFFKAPEGVTDANLEQQLVSNGLLAPDANSKQAQIEQMMNKANELYAAGQVEEAQNMYNEISTLNKELQEESAGIVK